MSLLRPLEIEDIESLNRWRNNRALTIQTQGFRYPISLEMDRKWYRDTILGAAPDKAIFAIQDTRKTAVGIAQLSSIDPVHRRAELGIYLGCESARGQGLGSGAVQELCAFAFEDLNLRRVFLMVTAQNTAAITSYARSGFSKEGLLREHYFADNLWNDVLIMGRLRDEK